MANKIELTPAFLSDLKEKAEKALPDHQVVYEDGEERYILTGFIAAANPAVVLALIAKIERLEKQNDELQANNYGPEILNDPQALTSCYFAGRMAEGREKNREMDKLLEENRRLEQENARLKIECHDLDSSGRETAKDMAKLEEEADWIAEQASLMCDCIENCDECRLFSECGCNGQNSKEVWRKAAQEAISQEEAKIKESEPDA